MHAGPVAPDLTQRPGVRRLAGVPLLGSCSVAELAAIAPLLRTERFEAGDELVAAGGREARFWIVVEGGAVIAAGERELGHLRPGDHYGEVGLLDGDPEPASVTATSPLLVLSCGKAGFDHILATAPGARSRVLVNAQRRRLAHRVADARPMPVLPRVVPPPPASMRRRVLLSLAATLAVVLVGTGVWFVSQRNHTTTFNLEDALSALHAGAGRPATASPQLQAPSATTAPSAAAPPDSSAASASATPAAAAPVAGRGTASASTTAVPPASTAALPPADLPAAGVYAYVTSGSDSISIGSKHQYPAETFAVLQRGDGCNWQVDHHVVDQHVDHIKRCGRPGNLMRVADASRVTFFGQTDGLEYVCDPPVPMIGDDATCAAADGSAAKYHAAVIDRPVVNVGGVSRDAIHILLTVTMTGRARGHASNQLWLDAATGMILHQIRDVDTQAHAAFGDVRYTEHAEFVLESMTPRQ